MEFNLKTRKNLFILLAILMTLIAGGLAISYVRWKKNRETVVGTNSKNPEQEAVCKDINEEAAKSIESLPSGEAESIQKNEEAVSISYPVHKNISSTIFWVGEKASADNKNISNSPSAWDDQWKKHYGGVDSSAKRNGFLPAKFCPRENPFYAALPYNDFNEKGEHKKELSSVVPWAKNINIADNYSILKNRWIKITHSGKIAYAQWEDVGPFGEDDSEYVFGDAAPKSKENKNAGIDVSPATRDYLGLSGEDKVDWQFVDSGDVPDGAWKKIITTSQVFWN